MKSDLQIAQEATLKPIEEIALDARIPLSYVEPYGKYKGKIDLSFLEEKLSGEGKLILVTAMNPTPYGEGKTTMAVALADGLRRLDKRTVLVLREPSLGPVLGLKGGAAGGGNAQVLPMEDINLHFTGDLHAITSANNLLAAMIDNHIFQGNALGIDPRRVTWHRCMDMNDRQLRFLLSGLGGAKQGTPREDHFDITAASEVMAILCLATDYEDLKTRLDRIVVGYTYEGDEVRACDLHAGGAMTALLKEAMKPNLVQTLAHTPTLMHGGPFANIAHGCNSVVATKMGLQLGDYVVTEAGFGAELGAEKFFDIKCRTAGLEPQAAVLVATLRALKHHGGVAKGEELQENEGALRKGLENLWRHAKNLRDVYGLPTVICLNGFAGESPREIALVKKEVTDRGYVFSYCTGWADGGKGALDLAEKVVAACEKASDFRFAYESDASLMEKIEAIAQKVYGAKEVRYAPGVTGRLRKLEKVGYGKLPVCIAKTQYSFSDQPKMLGAPTDFSFTIRDVELNAGAGFVVALAGSIIRMPGLPKKPAAEGITLENGKIQGLY
uniref:formate--tetrahydrofolate ligase n=1 Tax=Ndongobacter massiliensis TaxID=1871025 RepID=UPI0009309645|nr:formate--tetrahydrofolate ligase [Ndongobacter massiliensis]